MTNNQVFLNAEALAGVDLAFGADGSDSTVISEAYYFSNDGADGAGDEGDTANLPVYEKTGNPVNPNLVPDLPTDVPVPDGSDNGPAPGAAPGAPDVVANALDDIEALINWLIQAQANNTNPDTTLEDLIAKDPPPLNLSHFFSNVGDSVQLNFGGINLDGDTKLSSSGGLMGIAVGLQNLQTRAGAMTEAKMSIPKLIAQLRQIVRA